jgi:hypothetical protein
VFVCVLLLVWLCDCVVVPYVVAVCMWGFFVCLFHTLFRVWMGVCV